MPKVTADQVKLDEVVRDRGLLRTLCAAMIPDLTRYGRPNWETFSRTPLFAAWTKGARSESIAILRLVFRGLLRSFHLKKTLAQSGGIIKAVDDLPNELALGVLAYAAAWTGWSELKRDAEEATGAEWRIDPPDPAEYGMNPNHDTDRLATIHNACTESPFLTLGPNHWVLMFQSTVMMRRIMFDPEMADAIQEIRDGHLPDHRVVDANGTVVEPEKPKSGGIIIP